MMARRPLALVLAEDDLLVAGRCVPSELKTPMSRS